MARILIIEGPSMKRRIAASSLRDAGHEVMETSMGRRGLKVAQVERPDLVLVDTLLPDMDGGQFVRALRAIPNIPQPHVVFRAPPFVGAEARVLATNETGFFSVKESDAGSLHSVVEAALATPRPAPGAFLAESGHDEGLWSRLKRKLYLRTEHQERLIADLQLRNEKSAKQLKVARAAVDREIKKRVWAEQELARTSLMLKDQTMHDLGTGLFNRRYLDESLKREESRAQRVDQAFGVLMIDVQDLKQINQTWGHGAGDALLTALGQHIVSLVRGEDIVARYGKDEFALLMTQCPRDVILKRAEKLREGVGQITIEYKGQHIVAPALTVGIGIFPEHGKSGRDVVQAAQMALDQAKQLGREVTPAVDIESPAKVMRKRVSGVLIPESALPPT